MCKNRYSVENKSDLEKLLFAESYIKVLKQTIRVMGRKNLAIRTNLDELLYDLKNKAPKLFKEQNKIVQIKQLNKKVRSLTTKVGVLERELYKKV